MANSERYFSSYSGDISKTVASKDVDSSDDNDVMEDAEIDKKKKQAGKRNRSAISAEAFG